MKGQINLFPEEYIKDSDCTKDTPVVHGKPDTPIYEWVQESSQEFRGDKTPSISRAYTLTVYYLWKNTTS